MKFGIEYEEVFEGEEAQSVQRMQSYFLQRASDLVPKVSEDLIWNLLDLYQKIPEFYYAAKPSRNKTGNPKLKANWYGLHRPDWNKIEKASREGLKFKNQNIILFVERMFEWSSLHNLNEVWCREHAYETLEIWAINEKFRNKHFWRKFPFLRGVAIGGDFSLTNFIETNAFRSIPEKFVFEVEPHKLINLGTSEMKQNISAAFDEKLNNYIETYKKNTKANNLSKTEKKYNPDHFDWLINFQVKGLEYREIFKKYFPKEFSPEKGRDFLDDQTKKVRQAINRLSRQIKLEARKSGK